MNPQSSPTDEDGCESIFSPIHRLKIPEEVRRSSSLSKDTTPLIPTSPPFERGDHSFVSTDNLPAQPGEQIPRLRRKAASIDYSFLFPCRACAPFETPYPLSAQQRSARFRAYHTLVVSEAPPPLGSCEFYRELDKLTLQFCKEAEKARSPNPLFPNQTVPYPDRRRRELHEELIRRSRHYSLGYIPTRNHALRRRSLALQKEAVEKHQGPIPPLFPHVDMIRDWVYPDETLMPLEERIFTDSIIGPHEVHDAVMPGTEGALQSYATKQQYRCQKQRKDKQISEKAIHDQERHRIGSHITEEEQLLMFHRDLARKSRISNPSDSTIESLTNDVSKGLGALSIETTLIEEEEDFPDYQDGGVPFASTTRSIQSNETDLEENNTERLAAEQSYFTEDTAITETEQRSSNEAYTDLHTLSSDMPVVPHETAESTWSQKFLHEQQAFEKSPKSDIPKKSSASGAA